MKRKLITLAVIIVAAGLLLISSFDLFDTSESAPYSEFMSAIENGAVSEAELDRKSVV